MHNIQQNTARRFGKKGSFLLVAAFACLISTAAVFYANVNFSGEWSLNTGKSELGEWGERIAPKKLTITGTADAITINSMTPSPTGEETPVTEKLTFDGKENESKLFGNSKKKSSVKWSADGQVMTVNSVIHFDNEGQVMEIKVTEVWKMEDNGKTLFIESTSNSDFGTNAMKLKYDKK